MRLMEMQLHSFLSSVLDGEELSLSRSDRFTLGKKIPWHPPNEIPDEFQC
jgi:hypothetical protein